MRELEELTIEIQEKLPRLRIGLDINFNGNTQRVDAFHYKYPMLNDVLEWLVILELDNISVEFSNGEFCIVKDNRSINYWDDGGFKRVYWNLSSPYLKDQSPNLISFLHDLIK